MYAQLAEESLVSQLPPDLSPPLLQSSDLKNSEHNIGNLSLPIHTEERINLQ